MKFAANKNSVKVEKFQGKIRSALGSHKDQRSEARPAKSVPDALAELQLRTDAFQTEVDFCNQARLGRIEKGQQDSQYGLWVFAKDTKRTCPRTNEEMKRESPSIFLS